jgi:tripartite-type tricarboxylate transporter receptor subunit TctC
MKLEILESLMGIAVVAAAGMASAQAPWPQQPVKIIVPYSPGGTVDFSARQIGNKLSEQLGKPFIVENKVGASGTIGDAFVAKAAPDGYTLLANDTTYAMLPAMFKSLPWDHANDLVPVTTILTTPVVLVVPAASPFKTAQELVEFARRNPGKLNFGSGGVGSSTHLNAELFRNEAKIDIAHIPYKGAGDAMTGIISNQVDLLITASPTGMGQIKGGKVRALALTGARRSPAFPDVPTFGEIGLPGYTVTGWFGLAVPKGTPPEIVNRIHAETVKALADPGLRERIQQQGAEPGGMPPEQYAKFVREETVRWSGLARAAGVKPE